MNPNYIELKKLRIPELKKLCREKKIKGFSKLRKIQLVELLFKTLHPKEQKVSKEELKEPSPEIVLKKEPLKEVEPLSSLEIKVDLFQEKVAKKPEEKVAKKPEEKVAKKPEEKIAQINKQEQKFNEEYQEILKEKMKQIKIKNEKKKEKKIKKEKKFFLDLNDEDVIATINSLIKKIY